MKLFKTLERILPSSDCQRLAYFGDSVETRQFCNYYIKMHDAELFKLKDLPLKRWSFGGEFFEAMIIEDDTLLDKDDYIKMIKRSLKNDRTFIFISETLQASDLEAKLSAFGLSDFRTIESEPFICTARKWGSY